MKTELTLNALQSMNAQEYEDIRAAGSDMRRNLTHEVMREVDAPANWPSDEYHFIGLLMMNLKNHRGDA